MIAHTIAAPAPGLNGLVGQLFHGASRRRGMILAGWVLALGSHVGAAWFFAEEHTQALAEREPPAVDVEFVTPPAPPPPPEITPPAETKTPSASAAPAPPAAARAGALHLAKADAAPAQQADQAVDFTNDPNGASYGGGVVAVGGTAAFGAAGARVASPAGTAPKAPFVARPALEALVPVSDLSRKPQLPGADPCRGFFPSGARDDVGEVAVIVTINKAGGVTNTQLLSEAPSQQGFGAAARTCLASRHFTPALDRAGNSAATAVRVNLRFSR
jgi:periplasmic protein TonB